MAGKADFTDDEWKELQQGVTGSGMLVSTAHRDFTDAFGEASAVAKQLAAHRESESQLVRELSGTGGTGFGLVASPKEVVEGTMNALGDGSDRENHGCARSPLARLVEVADRLEQEAAALKERFNRDFWLRTAGGTLHGRRYMSVESIAKALGDPPLEPEEVIAILAAHKRQVRMTPSAAACGF